MKLNREKAIKIMSLIDELKAELVGTYISVEGELTTVVEVKTEKEVIEFEGDKYQKVGRRALDGDVVVFTKEQANKTHGITANKFYRVFGSDKEPYFITDIGTEFCVYYESFGRTFNTVDVYELIKEETKQEATFKVGDEVKVINNDFTSFKIGDIGNVIEYKRIERLYGVLNKNKKTQWFREEQLQLVEEKTANQQRAEIIEKAKKFVEDTKNKTGSVSNRKGYFYLEVAYCLCDAEFIVNPKKRTVVVLLKEQVAKKSVLVKAVAKCALNDVFNEHIGKAIALGRALGLDVSEFENAVQPNEVVVGHIVNTKQYGLKRVVLTDKEVNTEKDTCALHSLMVKHYLKSIINDTNAKYELALEQQE